MHPDVKVVILAGGLGSRLSEETVLKPKPMVEIGGRPIIWHIMKIYGHYGFHDFIVCLGYKGYIIKEYFANYYLHTSDVRINVADGRMEVLHNYAEPWRVTLVDTGETSQTGGRIRRILPYLGDDRVFALTYGDGLADINLADELAFHRAHGRKATVASVRPTARFGAMHVENDRVTSFDEKPMSDGGRVNGGFFFLSPSIGELIADDKVVWERQPIEALVKQDQLRAYRHDGFWHPMDTIRERDALEKSWLTGSAPWKLW